MKCEFPGLDGNQKEVVSDAFISYNKADEAWVQELASRIELETSDGSATGKKLSVFFAPWDIEYRENILNRLNDGLRQASYFLPVMSPEFFESGWANLEWTDQVALDPKNSSGRIIPIFLRDVSLDKRSRIAFPPPFGVLNRLDFRQLQDFEPSFTELVRILRGWPKQRGSASSTSTIRTRAATVSSIAHEYALPSSTPELLLTNLLKIDRLPESIWSGTCICRKPAEVWAAVDTNESFLLRDGKMFSFANIGDPLCPLSRVVDISSVGSPESGPEWLKSDANKWRYVEMLNRCVTQHLHERGIGRDEKGRFYFRPTRDETGFSRTRRFAFRGEKERDVAAKKSNPQDQSFFWVHYAARIRAEMLGDAVYLRIDPTFTFTKDGRNPLDGKSTGRLSIQWSGKQQNPDILRTLLFWARVLADGGQVITIPAGASSIRANFLPATASSNFGVGGDYIRIKALLEQAGETLDEVADQAEMVEEEIDMESDETDDFREEAI